MLKNTNTETNSNTNMQKPAFIASALSKKIESAENNYGIYTKEGKSFRHNEFDKKIEAKKACFGINSDNLSDFTAELRNSVNSARMGGMFKTAF